MNKKCAELKSVFIIGAAKCGTTALADMLDKSDKIALCTPKEPDFFSERINDKGLDWYLSLFSTNEATEARLDASVCYSAGWGESSEVIAKKIFAYDPDAYIIYLVRDPVLRAWSSYWHDVRNLKSAEGASSRTIMFDSNYTHISAGKYYERVREYLKYFRREQILILKQDEIISDSRNLLSKIEVLTGIDSLIALEDVSGRRVKSSYRFNIMGRLLSSVLPIDVVKKMAHFSSRNLPASINRYLRGALSNPVPILPDGLAAELVNIFSADTRQLYEEFQVDVRSSKFWHME